MTIYNSYEEAKIANPESDIYINEDDEYGLFSVISNLKGEYVICEPHEYCDSLSKFFDDGMTISEGDILLTAVGVVIVRDSFRFNKGKASRKGDGTRYILRAEALEKIPTETPEEKEALDSIESAGEAEWNGEGLPPVGIECEWIGGGLNHGDWGLVIIHAYHNGFAWIEKLRDNSMHTVGNPAHFRKPETPQQREDRERLEAAYDLYEEAQHAIGCIGYDDFDFFKKSDIQVKFWLAIVDKTNYRKEKTHDTN